MLIHHPLALRLGQRVPGARLDERIDEQVFRGTGLNDEPLLVPRLGRGRKLVNRAAGHREIAVGNRQIGADVGAVQRGLQLDERVEVFGHLPEQEVAITANPHEAVGPEQQAAVIPLERLPEFELRRRLALGGQSPPRRVQLVKGIADDLTLLVAC